MKGTISSPDGSRTITVEEFDRLFDEGSDEIDDFLDWDNARVSGRGLDVTVGGTGSGHAVRHRMKTPKDAAE